MVDPLGDRDYDVGHITYRILTNIDMCDIASTVTWIWMLFPQDPEKMNDFFQMDCDLKSWPRKWRLSTRAPRCAMICETCTMIVCGAIWSTCVRLRSPCRAQPRAPAGQVHVDSEAHLPHAVPPRHCTRPTFTSDNDKSGWAVIGGLLYMTNVDCQRLSKSVPRGGERQTGGDILLHRRYPMGSQRDHDMTCPPQDDVRF